MHFCNSAILIIHIYICNVNFSFSFFLFLNVDIWVDNLFAIVMVALHDYEMLFYIDENKCTCHC